MPNHIWSVLCQNLIVDAASNLVSMINIVTSIRVHELPASCPAFSLATLWERDQDKEKDEMKLRIHHEGPSGDKVHILETENLTFTSRFHRVNVHLSSLNVEQQGRHKIVVQNKRGARWKKETELPLWIELASEKTEEPVNS